tara:strand:- start:130 stop:675 length:546 start_codon:yes stop_codon:yes gene_type:complete
MKILGIDPSLSNFGLARADYDPVTGVMTPESLTLVETKPQKKNKAVRKNSEDLERLHLIVPELEKALSGVSMVMVEMPVGSQSSRAMASYGFCLGILAWVKQPMIQVTPSEVKIIATNDKTASKQMMIDWATQKYPDLNWLERGGKFTGKNEHLADALAAIEAGINTDQFKSAMAIAKFAA